MISAILCLQSALEAFEDEDVLAANMKLANPTATDEEIRASIAEAREHHETAIQILSAYNGIEKEVVHRVLESVLSPTTTTPSLDQLLAEEEDIPSRPPLEEYPTIEGQAGERMGHPQGPRIAVGVGKSWN